MESIHMQSHDSFTNTNDSHVISNPTFRVSVKQ